MAMLFRKWGILSAFMEHSEAKPNRNEKGGGEKRKEVD
jgi:hypothetical protein